jgi:hypothetical protein
MTVEQQVNCCDAYTIYNQQQCKTDWKSVYARQDPNETRARATDSVGCQDNKPASPQSAHLDQRSTVDQQPRRNTSRQCRDDALAVAFHVPIQTTSVADCAVCAIAIATAVGLPAHGTRPSALVIDHASSIGEQRDGGFH